MKEVPGFGGIGRPMVAGWGRRWMSAVPDRRRCMADDDRLRHVMRGLGWAVDIEAGTLAGSASGAGVYRVQIDGYDAVLKLTGAGGQPAARRRPDRLGRLAGGGPEALPPSWRSSGPVPTQTAPTCRTTRCGASTSHIAKSIPLRCADPWSQPRSAYCCSDGPHTRLIAARTSETA